MEFGKWKRLDGADSKTGDVTQGWGGAVFLIHVPHIALERLGDSNVR